MLKAALLVMVVSLFLDKNVLCISLKDEMFLTEDQKDGFDSFKASATPLISGPTNEYMKKDIILMKYYKASDMDETRSLKMLNDNLKWRLEMNIGSDDDSNDVAQSYPHSMTLDKSGREVIFVPGKHWDLSKAGSVPTVNQQFTQHIYGIIERAYVKISTTTGKTSSGIVYIADMILMDYLKSACAPCIQVMKDLLFQIQAKWPGGLQLLYIINYPKMMVASLNAIKNALPEGAKKLLSVYDDDDASWMPEIIKIMKKEQLPAELYVKSVLGPVGPAVVGGMPVGGPESAGQYMPGGGPDSGMGNAMTGGGMTGGMTGGMGNAMGGMGGAMGVGGKQKKGKKGKKKKGDDEEDGEDNGGGGNSGNPMFPGMG